MGSAGTASVEECGQGRAVAVSPPRDQRDSVPAADWPVVAGPAIPLREVEDGFMTVTAGGQRTAHGKGSCGPFRRTPTPRVGSTGAWSAWNPPPAGLISTRPEPVPARREFPADATNPLFASILRCGTGPSRTPSPDGQPRPDPRRTERQDHQRCSGATTQQQTRWRLAYEPRYSHSQNRWRQPLAAALPQKARRSAS